MDEIERLRDFTYALQHNPNCPSPYLIRMVGKKVACLDFKPNDMTADRLYFGETLKEAVDRALA